MVHSPVAASYWPASASWSAVAMALSNVKPAGNGIAAAAVDESAGYLYVIKSPALCRQANPYWVLDHTYFAQRRLI